MTDGEEDQAEIACSYCGSSESLTFVLMPGSGHMTTACSRCATIMGEARSQLEQTMLYMRTRSDRQDLEARLAAALAFILASVGVSAQWGVGYGFATGAGILTAFAILRMLKD